MGVSNKGKSVSAFKWPSVKDRQILSGWMIKDEKKEGRKKRRKSRVKQIAFSRELLSLYFTIIAFLESESTQLSLDRFSVLNIKQNWWKRTWRRTFNANLDLVGFCFSSAQNRLVVDAKDKRLAKSGRRKTSYFSSLSLFIFFRPTIY